MRGRMEVQGMIVLDRVYKSYRTSKAATSCCATSAWRCQKAEPRRAGRQRVGEIDPDPPAGRHRTAGRRADHAGAAKAVSFPVGFGGTLHTRLSGLENVVFLARLYGVDEREATAYVEAFAELGAYFRMPIGTYSSGMRARLAFGACLAIQFDVYLIDEVTSVGDARFRVKCLDAFHQRMDRADVIMVTHDYETMRAYCDIGAVLSGGRLTLFDDLEEAIDHHARTMRTSRTAPRKFS